MNVTGELDLSEFDAAIARYLPTTDRTMTDIINQRAANIAVRAFQFTPAANRGRMEKELGVSYKVTASRKTGKDKLRRKSRPVPMVYAIIQKRRSDAGLPGLAGKELQAAAKRLVGARLRSIGFHKSGYIPAIKALNRVVQFKAPFGLFRGVHKVGQDKGEVIIAKEGLFRPSVTIINTAREVGKFGAQALQQAINIEARELQRHVDEKMQKDADRFNAR